MTVEESKIEIGIYGSDGSRRTLEVDVGMNLRDALLSVSISPYPETRRQLNCRGLGICGTCRVGVKEKGGTWWRRSCQIRCFQPMEIELQ